MSYTAFVRIIINYFPGNTPAQQIVTKQYDAPNDFILDVDDLTTALNERLGMDVDSYTFIQKVNGQILDVEHVSHDSRLNFMVRRNG